MDVAAPCRGHRRGAVPVQSVLAAGGVLVVIEGARERFDDPTARWCFDRLPAPAGDPGWLQQRPDQWRTSGLPWGDYRRAWAQEEGPHTGQDAVGELDARFDRQLLAYGPISLPAWQASAKVIDAGQIQATRIAYIGRRRREGPASHPDLTDARTPGPSAPPMMR